MKSETPLMRMQKHFNKMVDAYNEMPEITDVIKKAILEDAIEIEALYRWHPLIKKMGGHCWYWDAKDECWKNESH